MPEERGLETRIMPKGSVGSEEPEMQVVRTSELRMSLSVINRMERAMEGSVAEVIEGIPNPELFAALAKTRMLIEMLLSYTVDRGD